MCIMVISASGSEYLSVYQWAVIIWLEIFYGEHLGMNGVSSVAIGLTKNKFLHAKRYLHFRLAAC